jgi:hypothetical protein
MCSSKVTKLYLATMLNEYLHKNNFIVYKQKFNFYPFFNILSQTEKESMNVFQNVIFADSSCRGVILEFEF